MWHRHPEASICFENWGLWVLKVQYAEARSTGLREVLLFYLIYTNLSITGKSPLWKVFSSHPAHYSNISWRPPRPSIAKSDGRDLTTSRINAFIAITIIITKRQQNYRFSVDDYEGSMRYHILSGFATLDLLSVYK